MTVAPIVAIVVILNFIEPIGSNNMWRFLIGAVLVIVGLTVFLVGVDNGITPIGQKTGSLFAKSNKILLVVFFTLLLGLIITVAEPSLLILGNQIEQVSAGAILSSTFVTIVSIGVAMFLVVGVLFILFDISILKLLFGAYALVLILLPFIPMEFMAIAFDSAGSTTGLLTVPFVLALAVGASSMRKDGKKSEESSFGLLGSVAAGAIFMVVVYGLFSRGEEFNVSPPDEKVFGGILDPFLDLFPKTVLDIIIALVPILIIFLIFQYFFFKLKKKPFVKIIKAIVYVFFVMILFTLGVNAGFMDVGRILGQNVGAMAWPWVLIISFAIGAVTVLAEPAVHVLTNQVEDVTSGYVSKKAVATTLSIGVGLAATLNAIRLIFPAIELWHILVPGYIIVLLLVFITPKLFAGMAFDSGSVASGPMIVTFIFAFSQGIAFRETTNVLLVDVFGFIALVAMTPLIAVQVLGIIFKIKSKKGSES